MQAEDGGVGNMQLTQKERSLLQDQQKHEQICIEKYTNYAEQTQDPELQQLFTNYAQQERQHYQTLDSLLQGQQPSTRGNQGQGNQSQMSAAQGRRPANRSGMVNQTDALLCNDMLMTEKYISSAYDTAVFEAANPTVRQALQHIQNEEQQHGEGIFNYMNQHGLYQPQ